MDKTRAGFGVLVPVKPTSVAKSRLTGVDADLRQRLVTAFAVDTVAAALEATDVSVVLGVTDDHVLAARLRTLGAEAVPDAVSDDLNASLRQAARELCRRHPTLRVAALCADLPGLRPDELDRALALAARHERAFLADEAGEGTTLVCARDADLFAPHFGVGSRASHHASGHHELDGTGLGSLTLDIDTPVDLERGLARGVGPRTREVAALLA